MNKKKEELQGSIVTPGGPEETPGNDNDDADDGGHDDVGDGADQEKADNDEENDDDGGDDDNGGAADGGDFVVIIDTPATKAKEKATNTSLQSVNTYDTLYICIYIYVCQYPLLDAKIEKAKRKLDQYYILSVFLNSKFPKAVWKIVTDHLIDWEAMFNLTEEILLYEVDFYEKKRVSAAKFFSFPNIEVFFRVSHVHQHT